MRLSPRQASERDTFEWRWVMRQRVVIAWEEKKVKKKSVLAIPNRSSYQFFCSPCWWVGVIIRGRKKLKLKFLQCSEFTLYVQYSWVRNRQMQRMNSQSDHFHFLINSTNFSFLPERKKKRYERSRCKFHDNFYENCFCFCAR